MDNIEQAKELINKHNIADIKSQLDQVNYKLNDFGTKNDFSSQEYIETLREFNKTNTLLSNLENLTSKVTELNNTSALLENQDMRELAEEELPRINEEISKLISSLKIISAKPLPNDDKKAIIEIRPGVGGVEASLFAEDLFRMYSRYCSLERFTIEIYNVDFNPEGGINEATFLIDEEHSFAKFRFEGGVHRVQRVPSTEAAGRIHTSTASVAILPKFEASQINISPEDLRIDVYRSSGPGGQSVNTTDSAVRITHIPSGLTVSCQNSKSQHKNKEIAMSVLVSRLEELERQKDEAHETNLRKEAIQGGDRSAKIRTYNFPQGRITDHRIGKSWFNIDDVINGEIGDIINETSLELRAE